ncbi:DNA-3-methyladenine glycosylase, partial [Candidatus Azambacteria bacterium]|nr:DNA-3-methyladenine glycosylase [Candidatus Azambacteria bacterium]
MARKLTARFFSRPTLTVARDLLGKYLVVRYGRKVLSGKIVETEAYIGEDDRACHASKGRTPRSETLYKRAGTLYVYLIYGMHHCLNIVTEKADFPSAVLIRAVEMEGADGPGKLCRAFGIDRRMNGKTVYGNALWIEDRGEKTPRTA